MNETTAVLESTKDVDLIHLTFENKEYGLQLTGRQIADLVNARISTKMKFTWVKLYKKFIPILAEMICSPLLNIVCFLIGLTDLGTNQFACSKRYVEIETKTAHTTVVRAFNALLSYDVIREVRQNVYMFNPSAFHSGGPNMDEYLLRIYKTLPKSEKAIAREDAESDYDNSSSELLQKVHVVLDNKPSEKTVADYTAEDFLEGVEL